MTEEALLKQSHQIFDELFTEFREATKLTKPGKAQKLINRIDMIAGTSAGIEMLYDKIDELEAAGIFEETAWIDPSKLVSGLVQGTIKSGHPNSTYELLSELRILAIARERIKHPHLSGANASDFLQEVVVSNLEFFYNDPMEETRLMMSKHELQKANVLFGFIAQKIELNGIKKKLADELELICLQRPVVTEKQRKLIVLIRKRIKPDPGNPDDRKLLEFQYALYRPTLSTEGKDTDSYKVFLESLDVDQLEAEAWEMGESMQKFGLVSRFHAVLLRLLVEKNHKELVPTCLSLSETGRVKWLKHEAFIADLIQRVIVPYNEQCIYGLANILETDIFSREVIRTGISNLFSIRINPAVEERILKTTRAPRDQVSSQQYLIGSLIRILGQPLGVRQGNNPTCQSARGISMWSQFAPARLINMLQTAAVHNDLALRFEDREVKSSETGKGLVQTLDYNLDAVSVTLVPLLDKIYNEMMIRASGRGEDPHKWVNPALYGQWIQVGFASAYDYLSNAIVDFDGFTRIFYAMCHPEYNGGYRLVYPNPVGIYITSSQGEMLGFHAISLLRVEQDPEGNYRAYFLNPNSEGRQDWGQNIRPSVFGMGERYGESSLPLHEFASRIYAFHYNSLEAPRFVDDIPAAAVKEVKDLAKNSWGKSYVWIETKKKW
ncbi:MAG: hypothetical protein KDC05_00565 [Bacteroidales bacterium]|nr:hypothetical protein [Bacteroidales bacterium]